MTKLLQLNSGHVVELVSKTTSAGSSDAGGIVSLNSSGLVDSSMLPPFAITTKIKSTNQSVTSSTTLVNETDLNFTIAANAKLVIIWDLAVNCSSAGTLDIAVTAPSGCSLLVQAEMLHVDPASGNTYGGRSTISGGVISLSPPTIDQAWVRINGTFINSTTAGTITLQFAQNASDATPTTILAMSTARSTLVA